MNVSDGELQVRWLAARDADAFAEIVSRHGAMVFAASRRILRNAADAEEISQECFLRLAQWKKRIRPSVGGWLHTVATRQALNRLRSDSRRVGREHNYRTSTTEAQTPTINEIGEHIDEVLSELPANNRSAVVYRLLEGRTHEECAALMGVSPSTAQYRVKKGVEQMRKALRRRGVVAGAVAITELLLQGSARAIPASLQCSLGTIAVVGGANATGGVAIASGGLLSWLAASATAKVAAGVGAAVFVAATALVVGAVERGEASELPGDTLTRIASSGAAPPPESIVLANQDLGEELTAWQVIEQFQATLASQEKFVFNFTDTGHVSNHATSPQFVNPKLEGDRTYHMAGELGSDGHRVAFRNKIWGQYNRIDWAPLSKSDPQHIRDVYDGNEMWWGYRASRSVTNERNRAGKVGIQRGRSDEYIASIVGHKAPTHWLQGYLSERGDRVDSLLRNAKTLSVRIDRETVGRSTCDIIDFSSPYGEGTLWLDPDHGYLLAQAEVYLGAGHILTNGIAVMKGASMHFKLRDVSFRKVDGVWFATAGEIETDLVEPRWREVRTNKVRVTNIRANSDMDALELFSTDDIEEGATIGYIGEPTRHVWRGGRMVLMSGRGR